MAFAPLTATQMNAEAVFKLLRAREEIDLRFSSEEMQRAISSAVTDQSRASHLMSTSSLARGADNRTSIRDLIDLFQRRQSGLFSESVREYAPELVAILVALSQNGKLTRLAESVQMGSAEVFAFGPPALAPSQMNGTAIKKLLLDRRSFELELNGAQMEALLGQRFYADAPMRSNLLTASSQGAAESGGTSIASLLASYEKARDRGGLFSRTKLELIPILVNAMIAAANDGTLARLAATSSGSAE